MKTRIRRFSLPHRWAFGLVAAVAVLVVGGASALAYFRAVGSGSGSATSDTAQAVTVQAVSSGAPAVTLIPGGTADLLVQVSNPNTFAVTIVGVSQNGNVSVIGGASCTSDPGGNSGVSVPSQSALSVVVSSGTHVVTIPNGAAMSASSASGCQGATFQVPVLITVRAG